MSINFQDSNVMLTSVRSTSKSKRAKSPRRVGKISPDTWNFATLLAENEVEEVEDTSIPEVLRGLPTLSKLPLDPAVYMQQLYGREFDPSTGRVNHGVFLERTQEKTTAFAQMFHNALQDSELDTEQETHLLVNELGQVEARTHSQARAITGLFATDRDLAQSYRDMAEAHHWAALTEIGSAYVEAWYGTEDFDVRDDISDRFRDIFDSLADCASQMTYNQGNLESASVSEALKALSALSSDTPEAGEAVTSGDEQGADQKAEQETAPETAQDTAAE